MLFSRKKVMLYNQLRYLSVLCQRCLPSVVSKEAGERRMRLSTETSLIPHSPAGPIRTPTQTVHRLADGGDHFYCTGRSLWTSVSASPGSVAPMCAQIVFRDRDGLIGGVEWVQQRPRFLAKQARLV